MFRFPKRKLNTLDLEIELLLKELNKTPAIHQDNDTIMSQIERLYKLKAQDASRKVSPDTALLVAANLVGIGVIVRHEQFNVITSKAMSFVIKPK